MTGCTCFSCRLATFINDAFPEGMTPDQYSQVLSALGQNAGQMLAHGNPETLLSFSVVVAASRAAHSEIVNRTGSLQ